MACSLLRRAASSFAHVIRPALAATTINREAFHPILRAFLNLLVSWTVRLVLAGGGSYAIHIAKHLFLLLGDILTRPKRESIYFSTRAVLRYQLLTSRKRSDGSVSGVLVVMPRMLVPAT